MMIGIKRSNSPFSPYTLLNFQNLVPLFFCCVGRHLADSGMQVTIAFNHFGEALVQRMPRCRLGYIHVVNNDFTAWEMYAIGGSANPTINSQGNRYTAPVDPNAKEVKPSC